MVLPARTPSVGGAVGAPLARWSLALVLVWSATTRFTGDGAAVMGEALAQNRIFSGIAAGLDPGLLAWTIGLLQLGAGLLLATGKRPGRRLWAGALVSCVLAALSLTLFLTNPVWIESMGGFPFLGSGQGLLKSVAILGVSLYLLAEATPFDAPHRPRLRRAGLNTTLIGLILVLGWIGAMKFTAVEAQGIEPLLLSSPLLSWMLAVFSIQGASNFIGAAELVTVVLLSMWWLRPSLYPWGAALGLMTFVTSLSFLLTLPGWHDDIGFPALSAAGLFLIKDLVLLAGILILQLEMPRPDVVIEDA